MNSSYLRADSAPAARRVAEEWVRLQPRSGLAWHVFGQTLELQGRGEEALAAIRRAAEFRPGNVYIPITPAIIALRSGEFDRADRLLGEYARSGSIQQQLEAVWFLMISFRMQGRLEEALATAREYEALASGPDMRLKPEPILARAQVLFEMGHAAEAARLFGSLLDFRRSGPLEQTPSALARQRTWTLTHIATARAAAGDTTGMDALADSMASIGARSLFGRDRRLHHHARGLLLRARGQPADAAEEFRRAVYSRAAGYTRTNLELAQLLVELNRPLEAVEILQPAFRGSLEASNFYMTHTELHAALGRAWEAVGRADSAAAHYRWVVRALRDADTPLRARRDSLRARLAGIERGDG